MRIRLCLLIATTALFSGCSGETDLEVRQRYRPRYEALRKEFAELAKLPMPTAPMGVSGALNPRPIVSWGPDFNTLIVPIEQLRDIGVEWQSAGDFDLNMHSQLLYGIKEMARPDSQLHGKANKFSIEALERPFRIRYLAAVGILGHRRADLVEPAGPFEGYKEYTPGAINGTVWLIDRRQKQIIGAAPFQAATEMGITPFVVPPMEQETTVRIGKSSSKRAAKKWPREDERRMERSGMHEKLNDSLRAKTQESVVKALVEITGGALEKH